MPPDGPPLFDACDFVREHGVVLVSARGPVPNLAEVIAGERIRGSWWAHPAGKTIYAATRALADDPEVLCCRLVQGHMTFVHRRLWPALVRLALGAVLQPERCARIVERHTESGRHESVAQAFPEWVPKEVLRAAAALSLAEARTALGHAAPAR